MHRLSAFRELKSALWTHVLSSTTAFKAAHGVHACLFKCPEFSRFVTYLRHYQYFSEVDKTLSKALYAFVTTPIKTQTEQLQNDIPALAGSISKSSSMIAFSLSFTAVTSLQILLSVLNAYSIACLLTQVALKMLDFSDNPMDAEALALITRILQKKNVYQFQELKLH